MLLDKQKAMKNNLKGQIEESNNHVEEYIELIGSNFVAGSVFQTQNAQLLNLELQIQAAKSDRDNLIKKINNQLVEGEESRNVFKNT